MFESQLPYRVFDADNHFYEPPGFLLPYLEERFHDRAEVGYVPNRAKEHHEKILAQREAERQVRVPGTALGKGNIFKDKDAEERERIVAEFRLIEGSYQNRDHRIAVMDAQGIEATIMFPTSVGTVIWRNNLDDPEANIANVRAYNRWADETWGFSYHDRILTPAALGLVDLDAGLAELDRVIAAGARTVLVPPGPLYNRAPGDPIYDPLWSRIEEAGVRPVVHLNHTRYQVSGKYFGYEPEMHYHDGFDAFQWLNYWGDRPVMETISSLVFDNFFTRFPNIKFGIVEHGAVYLPYLLRKMDHAVLMGKATRHGTLPARPSEIFREHFVVAPYPEENIEPLLGVVGVDTLVFGSDFPHPEGLPDPVSYVSQLSKLTEADQRKIMRDNLAGFLSMA
jgi:predicted TIM-barrel fold metal-dependent hydrolase